MSLAIDKLSVTYRMPEGERFQALAGLSLSIASGEFVALLGPSGCGKSTLIRVLAGLQKPTQGRVLLDYQILHGGAHPDIAVMFQDASLMPWRTVFDNVALPLEIAGINSQAHEKAINPLLQSLGLFDFAQSYPSELSGGMAQRVALARVLVQSPQILLLDEPFGALDALTREQISMDLLDIWATKHQTMIMVTHNISEAVLLADRILVFTKRPGRILADIPVMLSRPRKLDMIYTGEFTEIARHVREQIDRA